MIVYGLAAWPELFYVWNRRIGKLKIFIRNMPLYVPSFRDRIVMGLFNIEELYNE